jgi:hypothetical protein
MALEVERFVRIQRRVQGRSGFEWRNLPNGARVMVWEHSVADALADEAAEDPSPKRYIFHIDYVDGVERGCLVTYLGQKFMVLSHSDSQRLRGLELRCVAAPTDD